MGRPLSPKTLLFVEHYASAGSPTFGNATRSALAAGLGNGKESFAARYASKLLKHDGVKALVKARLDDAKAELRDRAVKVVNETYLQATVDIGDLYGPDGELLPLEKMPADVRRCIAQLEVEELRVEASEEGQGGSMGIVRKLKLIDRRASQELFLKWAGALTEKVEHTGAVGVFVVDPYAEPKKK